MQILIQEVWGGGRLCFQRARVMQVLPKQDCVLSSKHLPGDADADAAGPWTILNIKDRLASDQQHLGFARKTDSPGSTPAHCLGSSI